MIGALKSGIWDWTACNLQPAVQIHPQTWVIIGMVVIIATLFLRRARTKRAPAGAEARAGLQGNLHNQRRIEQARDDIEELMVHLEEVSREICGQIDTRFAKLQHAIREADAKLAALRQASCDQPEGPAGADDALDPAHAEICRRGAAGQSAAAIARELGMPVGEVELILSLHRGRPAPTGCDPAPAAHRIDR
ncbi:MAG: hypothetical protein GX591_04850, partial [Planctomycetes bacterium]|nr:hypothetical protein [Planctomycetota bacterium]